MIAIWKRIHRPIAVAAVRHSGAREAQSRNLRKFASAWDSGSVRFANRPE
jgi:hypothetical protein